MPIIKSNIKSSLHGYKYSSIMASVYGLKEAVVLEALAYCAHRAQINDSGKFWFFITIDDLYKKYKGFISRSAIHRILAKLVDREILLKKDINRYGALRTCYTFKNDSDINIAMAKRKGIYFCPNDAVELGVAEAVIIHNIAYWVLKSREFDEKFRWQAMTPNTTSGLTGIHIAAVRRALAWLVKTKVLECRKSETRTIEYAFIDEGKYLDVRNETYYARHIRVEDQKFMRECRAMVAKIDENRAIQNGTSSVQNGIPYIIDTSSKLKVDNSLRSLALLQEDNLTNKKDVEYIGYGR